MLKKYYYKHHSDTGITFILYRFNDVLVWKYRTNLIYKAYLPKAPRLEKISEMGINYYKLHSNGIAHDWSGKRSETSSDGFDTTTSDDIHRILRLRKFNKSFEDKLLE